MTYARCDRCGISDEREPKRVVHYLAVQGMEWVSPVYIHLCSACLAGVLTISTVHDGKRYRAAKPGDVVEVGPDKPRKWWLWRKCDSAGVVPW